MPTKVKRGLGLLVVALLAFIIGAAASAVSSDVEYDGIVYWTTSLLAAGLGLGAIALALTAMAMIAWGLLRD